MLFMSSVQLSVCERATSRSFELKLTAALLQTLRAVSKTSFNLHVASWATSESTVCSSVRTCLAQPLL
jgi:hypothetical protein